MSQDSQLQQAVLAELSWDPSLNAAHIGVTAAAGIVTLSGHVDSFAEKHAAEKAVHRVKGVKATAQEIEVLLPFDRKRGDDDIAAAVLDRLAWDVALPKDAISVKVEQGVVTLTGHVDWFFQKRAAEQNVRRLAGVVGITNLIVLAPRVDTSGISADITRALHRSWLPDDSHVRVSAEGGTVRLKGTVHGTHDRQVAWMTAWAAPGTTRVENDIVVV